MTYPLVFRGGGVEGLSLSHEGGLLPACTIALERRRGSRRYAWGYLLASVFTDR